MIKALIFDLDGTLADTIESIRAAINITMRHYGYTEKSYDEVKAAIGSGARMLIKRLLPDNTDDTVITQVLEHYNNEYSHTYTMADCCYDGMHEAVCALAERGYKIAVLSNKPDVFVKDMIKILFNKNEIPLTAGQTDLPTKPDPTVPLIFADRLGVSAAECAFIGDSEVDVLTARNAGMLSVGCSWGYRGSEVLKNAEADYIIDNPDQLLRLFGEIRSNRT